MRFKTADGHWRVDVIELDGVEMFRVHEWTFWSFDTRSVDELRARLPFDQLREAGD